MVFKKSTVWFLLGLISQQVFGASESGIDSPSSALDLLRHIATPDTGIGTREAGSEQERQTAKFIQQRFKELGLNTSVQQFKQPILKTKGEYLRSLNVVGELPGKSKQTLVLGTHFDSTGSHLGSQGAMDNASGVAVLLAVAAQLSQMETLPFTVRFLAFGAEESGKIGSRAYVRDVLSEPQYAHSIIGMINLDTVAGGDFLYVHSAHEQPYPCGGNNQNYSASTLVRDGLQKASRERLGEQAHQLHPAFPGYPQGVTGDWSDHEPFACQGIPIAYIETTNFQIRGKGGYDGYSQTTHPALWDCFDKATMGACQPETEKQWGQIWHTGNDQLARLASLFPGRIERQLHQNVTVLVRFFSQADRYLGRGAS